VGFAAGMAQAGFHAMTGESKRGLRDAVKQGGALWRAFGNDDSLFYGDPLQPCVRVAGYSRGLGGVGAKGA
jgi:hypothetical protein